MGRSHRQAPESYACVAECAAAVYQTRKADALVPVLDLAADLDLDLGRVAVEDDVDGEVDVITKCHSDPVYRQCRYPDDCF